MLELLAIAMLSVGSLPPLEPPVKQKLAQAAPADQTAASAARPSLQAKAASAPAKAEPALIKAEPAPIKAEPAPIKAELGPVAAPEIRSEGRVSDKADPPPDPALEAPKKPAPKAEKKAKRTVKAEKAEAETKHDAKAGDEGKEPARPDAEAPTEDQQHAAAPSLAPGAICDELRRAARDRREDRFKLTQEREALAKERTRLEALAEEIAQARTALKEETARLQAVIDKVNDKAKGARPGLPAPTVKPTAAASGGSASLADAGRK